VADTLRDLADTSVVTGRVDYVVDTRPLCQGMPFLLTDAAHPRMVLKHGSHFLVIDESASIPACNTLGYGYYQYDTRYISTWELLLDDTPLSLLSSAIEEGYAGSFLYTNAQTGVIPQQKITIHREIVLTDLLWERITIESFHSEGIHSELKIKLQSDFADMFEVRGLNRPTRGTRMVPTAGNDGSSLFLAYRGEDGRLLETIIDFKGVKPERFSEGEVVVKVDLEMKQALVFEMCITTLADGKVLVPEDPRMGYGEARKVADSRYKSWLSRQATIMTDHQIFDRLMERSYRDMYILRQPTPKGTGLAAGIPWYSAVFGRDSAITAMQIIPFLPDVSRECLQVLARYQGQKIEIYRAEEPGRIMHELRVGELARTGAIPHSPYYGTVDATQLWLMLFSEYVNWTGDLETAHHYWPNVVAALKWLDDALIDGYIWYQRESDKGLENQGWKDSGDSVMHINGALADPPIAICEAQAYIYAAKIQLAKIADLVGHSAMGEKLRQDAIELKERFEKDFWLESEDYLSMALDGHGKPVGVLSSNPGHCLWTGILSDDKANLVADRLMSEDLYSGWGIRTLAQSTSAFNPMSYHNGSVWPHDNAIIAEGLRKIGRIEDTHKIMKALYDVAKHEAEFRLPELFCGFGRHDAYRPINYPVSCSPQAWAAGSMFQMLKACINFEPDACSGRLKIVEPHLPEWLGRVTIRGLRIGGAMLDLTFNTQEGSSACQILKKSGNVRIIVEN
jgi:glycogen debranching enzyme